MVHHDDFLGCFAIIFSSGKMSCEAVYTMTRRLREINQIGLVVRWDPNNRRILSAY